MISSDTEEFNFELEDWRIAQTPLEKRDESKLLVIDKKTGKTSDEIFENIGKYLKKGDTLVLNDTKVMPARIFGHREGKEEAIEVLLLKQNENDRWQCLVKPGKKMKIGTEIIFDEKLLRAEEKGVSLDKIQAKPAEYLYNGIGGFIEFVLQALYVMLQEG